MVLLALALVQTGPKLPAPGKSVIRVPKLVKAPRDFLKAPKGYTVDLFAEGLRHPRKMAVAPNGDVFGVQTRLEIAEKNQPNEVVVLHTPGVDGRPTKKSLWAKGLEFPFGIQFGFGCLYVANTGSVVRWIYHDGQHTSGFPQTVITGIPQKGYRNHWTRDILVDQPGKRLYLTIGSEENLAVEGPRRAVIESYSLSDSGNVTSGPTTLASGLRNPIGLALRPGSKELWATVAERDYKGDDLVPDFVTSIKPGGFYGWPYCYIGQHHDQSMPHKPELEKKAIVPDILLPAHSTPIDIAFGPDCAFVTLHGSQNRSRLNGYKVVRLPYGTDGRPNGKVEDFLTGWLPKGSNREIYGRPAGMAWRGSSLLVVDDWGGRIFRVRKAN
ncbi:MAG: PQQ-dependent sugar dehydrogenase [Armatimonadetes bacterium]|nr:PQQ-dependent sugar dehydrogenase [Armatimonadota bacterium]